MSKISKESIGGDIVRAEQYLENTHANGAIACALIAIAKMKFLEMKEVK